MNINSPKWPYNTTAWRKLRALHLKLHPFCEGCLAIGRYVTANTVDHRLAISQGGDPFPGHEGLASYCVSCHSAKTVRSAEAGAVRTWKSRKGCNPDGTPLDPSHPWLGGTGWLTFEEQERRLPSSLQKSAIPLTIVCGPPGSGKSTYIRENARPDDIIICLDTIVQQEFGLPEHQTPAWCLPKALNIRNTMLHSLASETRPVRAFFIVAAKMPRDREKWAARLGGTVHVIDTPAVECIKRIRADPTRDNQQKRMVEAVLAWWRANPHLERKFFQKSLRAKPSQPPPKLNFELVRPGENGADREES